MFMYLVLVMYLVYRHVQLACDAVYLVYGTVYLIYGLYLVYGLVDLVYFHVYLGPVVQNFTCFILVLLFYSLAFT